MHSELIAHGTLLLSRRDVARLLDFDTCMIAIEEALHAEAKGHVIGPAVLGMHVQNGGFHVKAASLTTQRPWFAAKCNANFPGNFARFGLPTIQGLVLLHDASNGRVLAVMDSIEITIVRTAATTALAAKHLARTDSHTLTIVGCGSQGDAHARALCRVLPIRRVQLHDIDPERANDLGTRLTTVLANVEVIAVTDVAAALRSSDVIATCTTSDRPIVNADDVRSGTFVAGVGADNPHKHELAPSLFADSKIVVDHREQCATIGDLHHALAAGAVDPAAVHADLGEIITGKKVGRQNADEVTLFDSTGTALQDVAAVIAIWERASIDTTFVRFPFAS